MNDEEKAAFFAENGYLVVENLLGQEEVEQLRASVTAIQARANGLSASNDRFKFQLFGEETRIVQQVAEPHEMGGEWMALARDKRILDNVELMIGPNIMLYYSMMMMKPAHAGAPAPWHQDLSFFT